MVICAFILCSARDQSTSRFWLIGALSKIPSPQQLNRWWIGESQLLSVVVGRNDKSSSCFPSCRFSLLTNSVYTPSIERTLFFCAYKWLIYTQISPTLSHNRHKAATVLVAHVNGVQCLEGFVVGMCENIRILVAAQKHSLSSLNIVLFYFFLVFKVNIFFFSFIWFKSKWSLFSSLLA